MGEIRQIKVAKCTESELDATQQYLQDMEAVIESNQYESDDKANKQIADVARKLPQRAFIVPLNLGILLDNYQDKDSNFLVHPKWIMDMYNLFEEIDTFLSENKENRLKNGSVLHEKIKKIIAD
jgi:hypothetical protein